MSNAVVMVDLTCRTPQYDRCLVSGLRETGCTVDLWAAGCYSNTLYDADFSLTAGCMDVMAHLPGISERMAKRLKAAEYGVNLLALWWHVQRNPVDLIHFQWLPLMDVTTVELDLLRRLQRRGTRIVYTVHDLLPLDAQNNEAAAVRDRFRAVYQCVDALICHTNHSRERLIGEFGIDESKIWHIPHGPLAPLDFSTAPAESIQDVVPGVTAKATTPPTVLLFGVLRPYKGYDFLLDAWPAVRAAMPSARLLIVGRADEAVQSEIESQIAAHDIGASVERVYRYVSDAELHAVLDAATVLVYPYRNITQSGALFTGMNLGKPIVATDVGGLGETIRDGKTGLLVPFGDTQQLADALIDLIRDADYRDDLGTAVQEELATRLSWTQIAKKTQACYRAVRERTRAASNA